jgi:hypothetical protein
MERILNVQYGTIYTQDGIGIDNMAVIIDKDGGLIKYGDSEKYLDKYYSETISKYKKAGLDDIANDLLYVKFDRYDGVLSIDEICTFVNYMIMCSANGNKIVEILSMPVDEMKNKIEQLKEMDY